MIDKLILKNIQPHKSSIFDFCSGVNAIVGESDEGKTTIVRALKEVTDNKVNMDTLISDFSKRKEGSITVFVDNNKIERLKNKTKNEYRINDQPFKALGKSGVPDEVKNILQLSELNFQNQMDSPFLLSANGGEVARYLNEVADLNIISESLTKAKSKVDSANRDIKTVEIEVESGKVELSGLDWVFEAEKELLQLEDNYFELKNSQSLQEYLIDTLEEADDLTEALEPYKDLDNRLQTVELLIQHTGNWLFDQRELNEFKEHLNEIDGYVEALEKYKDHDQELYDISLLVDEYKNYQAQSDYLNSFKSDLNSLKTISNQIDSLPFDEKEIANIELLVRLINDYLDKDLALDDFEEIIDQIEGFQTKKEVCVESIQTLETEFKNEFPTKCDSDTCPLMEV